jgi:transcriptional regulator with XRE-family HTH domain
MDETRQLIEALKRCLKLRGLTYAALARRVNLSEASIKRIFARRTFTLRRLEQVCRAAELSFAELTRVAQRREHQATSLSLEQEAALARDPLLLSYFYLLLNGTSEAQIRRDYEFGERHTQQLRRRLLELELAEELPRRGLRPRVSRQIVWRRDGPVRRAYERQVKEEFLRSEFAGRRDFLGWQPAELTDASIEILRRKLRQLYEDFLEMAELDASSAQPRYSTSLLLAFRPWVLSLVAARRRRAPQRVRPP